MFQVAHRKSGSVVTVYAVHKSGPRHEQTKFLIHMNSAWTWDWARYYEPAVPTARTNPSPRYRTASQRLRFVG